jgi:hypothetical protein
MIASFSPDYAAARKKFLELAAAAKAEVASFRNPLRGPAGEELAADVAWLGPRSAERVFVSVSATHGVEGFFGSGVQIEWLRRREQQQLPPGCAALLVHAINPYGFAWQRRTNEDNVDLNRNWLDFSQPLPANPGYEELAADLCPADWSPESQMRSGERLGAWVAAHGPAAFQQAVSGGQWSHPKGIFYGGKQPTWSRKTLSEILQAYLGQAGRVLLLDFHTGLGPHGYAELISHRRHDDPGFARTRAWIGAAVTSIQDGDSVSAKLVGDWLSAVPALLPAALVDGVVLECGVLPLDRVAYALRADAWLHAYGDPRGAQAPAIKQLIRAAFHGDDPAWQGMALGQGLASCRAAMAGLKL